MAENLSKPFSIRLSPAQSEELAAIMSEIGWKKNPAIAHLLTLGIQTYRDMPKYGVRPGPAPKRLKNAKVGSLVAVQSNTTLVPPSQTRDRWAVFATKAKK